MSAGKFNKGKYEADNGDIHAIRIQPETEAASVGGTANTPPAGAITAGVVSARGTGSSRRLGLRARRVYFTWNPAQEPSGYKEESAGYIVILKKAHFDAIGVGAAVSYLGGQGTVTGKAGESKR